jgi:decaprenylphospho-beta-D-erythro-pentofuranosid-2-ulose 2-reductase
METGKTILILGANSDVAKEIIRIYAGQGNLIIAASRSTDELNGWVVSNNLERVEVRFFDAADFHSHLAFYHGLSIKPNIVVYAAGYLKANDEALRNWEGAFQMMKVHYIGAVSILNIIAMDESNKNLERIVGLSSLSGVRGRKSNFIYGSTKSAFTQYLAGLRQYLRERKIMVNVVVAGYIRSKMTAGLNLPESLMLEPEFVAAATIKAGNDFVTVPGFKWKIIYHILRLLPESLVAKLP